MISIKKFFMLLWFLIFTQGAFAAVEVFSLPALNKWIREPSVILTPKGKALIPGNGGLFSPKEYKTQYGDCIVVTFLYSGKGRLQILCNEMDQDFALLHSSAKMIVNPADEVHSRSVTFPIENKGTKLFQLEIRSEQNTGLALEDVTVRRMYGSEENVLYNPSLNQELWKKRTRGRNLALGKKVTFFPEPNYDLTKKGGSDSRDLTDGKLSTRFREYIWFDPLAVGWSTRAKQIFVTVDLGSVKNVGTVVARICGGRSDWYDNYGWFPSLFEVWVSLDGKQWFKTSSMKKVKINERSDADWKTLYYLPEIQNAEAPPYMYPFELAVHARARYVTVGFRKDLHCLYMDELAVMEERTFASGFNDAYKKEADKELFNKESVVIPYYPEIYVHRGDLHLPNWFKLDDRRVEKEGSFAYFIDMPEGISYTPAGTYPVFTRFLEKTERKNGRVIYYFKNTYPRLAVAWKEARTCGVGPFFFRAEKEIPAAEQYVRIGTTTGKKMDQRVVRKYKLNILDIPKAPLARNLVLGVPWISVRVSSYWPEYGKTLRHLGINAAGWHGAVRENSKRAKKVIADLKKHSIAVQAVPATSFALITKLKPQDRIYSCTGKNRGQNQICPSYRGKYYSVLCKGVAQNIAGVPADMVHLDFETWFTPRLFKECTRCDALRKTKGMSWEDFTPYIMADFYKGILIEVRKAFPKARIGSYMYCLDRKQEQNGKSFIIFGTDLLFPEYLDEVQTPYYGPNPAQVTKRVRANFKLVKDPRKVCVYLTAGAGAYGVDQMGDRTFYELLEAYMNGAYSIAYYVDRFITSPLDYMYMAKGMSVIQPHEDFLMKAALDESFKGSNPELIYTCRTLGKKALILMGNYESGKNAETFLALKNVQSVKECISSVSYTAGKEGIRLTVPGRKALLLEVIYR